MTRIAINGFGRIGRIFFRQAFGRPDLEIVAVNDLGSAENLAYLLKHDSVYREYGRTVVAKKDALVVDGQTIPVFSFKELTDLPWKQLVVDIVVEATGVFDSSDKARGHIKAGAKRVVITAPPKDDITPVITPGIGAMSGGMDSTKDNIGTGAITSNASCTTNATNPVVVIMLKNLGIKKAVLTTVHGYTATQGLVDGPDRKDDFRRARAAAVNIVPSTTGAAQATTRSIPELLNKFDGLAIRVPVISGSLIDFTFVSERSTSVEEVNQLFRMAAAQPEWQGILMTTDEPLVSSDILGNPHGSIVDLALTKVVGGDLIKVFSWYDNEWGYCAMLLKHVERVAELLEWQMPND